MLKWLIHRRLDAFEARFAYDMSYARDVLDADLRGFLAFARVTGIARHRREVPLEVHYAVQLAATLAEDCGPCTQLVVTMGLREGVSPRALATVAAGRHDDVSDDVRLGVQFAEAVLRHDPAADALREEVLRRWGPRALVSLGLAITASRMFPTLKYALGHGRACRQVVVAGEPVRVLREAS